MGSLSTMHGANVLVGIAASVGAAVLLSSGTILQALGTRTVPLRYGLRLSLLARLVRRPRWVLGTVVGYLAFPLELIAFGSAPLVLVQPVHILGILLVLAAGTRILGERVSRREAAGAAAILVGMAMLAWGAPPGPERAVSEAALAGAAGGLAIVSFLPYALGRRCGRLTLMICAGLGFAGANMAVKGISDHLGNHEYLGAAWFLAIAAVASTIGVLNQMSAFQRYRAIEVVPITFALPNFVPMLLALVVLREHWGSAALAGAPFAIGGALLLVGTAAVARAAPVTRLIRQAAG